MVETYGENIYCDSCRLSFTNTIFKDSLAYEGSVIFVINSALMLNVAMKYGKAKHYGGAIYVEIRALYFIHFRLCSRHNSLQIIIYGGYLYV
jgi:hypothetical protein